jgi:hypothetical protein
MRNYLVPAFALLPDGKIDKTMGMMLYMIQAESKQAAADKAKDYGQGAWMPLPEEINEIGKWTYDFNGRDCGAIVQWIR